MRCRLRTGPACGSLTGRDRRRLARSVVARAGPFTEEVTRLGWEAGGEGTSRIAEAIGLPASAETVLRILRAAPDPPPPPATVIGIDGWAIRKRIRYGTLAVDQERHILLDLLRDREEETAIAWLRAHPEVTVIARDRDGVYANAAAKGTPQARLVEPARSVLRPAGKRGAHPPAPRGHG